MKKLLQIPLLLVALILTSIPISAHHFEVDGIYYNILSSTTVEVTYEGSSIESAVYTGAVTIPSSVTYNSTTYFVTEIGSSAFRYCTLTSVTIPNSVTEIGYGAFYGCSGLTSVDIPNSVISIGHSAFSYCTGLTSITSKSETPPTIQSNSFPNYNTTLYIPFGTLEAYQSAEYWSNFANIVEDSSIDGLKYSINSDTEVTVIGVTGYINNIIIPSTITINNKTYTVTEIADSAFINCNDLASISIPNTVTTIGAYAFSGCSGLTSVAIPNSVSTIGDGAFYNCTGLTEVNFNAENCTKMGSALDPVFNGCTNLTTLNIGENVKSIPAHAFRGCTGLTSVTIPNSVTEIGSSAFSGCSGLTSVDIPNSVTSIGNSAFYNCTGLTSVTIPNSVTSIGDSAFSGCSGLTSVTIPNSVTSIGGYAFRGCSGLTSVTIPNSVTSIGGYAFRGCTGLTEVNFNAENCTSMDDHVFNGCTNLTTLNIGDHVKSISAHAFRGCTGLTSVTIPNSVTEIGSSAFSGCSGLTSVDIPNSVTSIGNSAFYNCTGLTSVNFNAENCTSMGDSRSYHAFNGCTNLTTLNIGDNVKTIPDYAFYNCTGLTEVNNGNSVTSIGYDAFWGCNKLIDGSIVATTQTTATINITSPTQYNLGLYYNDNDKKQAENGVIKFTGLGPNATISRYDLALIINGIYCPIKDFSFKTSLFKVSLSEKGRSASSITVTGAYTEGDVTILGEGINWGSNVSEFDGKNTITVNNLDPFSSYTVYYAVKIQEGGVYSTSQSFTTSALELTTQEAKPTSTTSVRLLAATNCDATEGTGFEWRRYDAPDELPSSKVSCPVVDGVLVGSLRGVNADVYYKYRPYYTSSSGNTYYGDWIAFFTGDANVYFEPDVRTYDDIQVINNSATVKGYALEGTDVITAQGFEYWKTGSAITPSSTENRMTVNASGIAMSATLANLEYNSTYKYRAFVTTAKGTVYGDEVEFSTGNDPAGIGNIEIDADEFSVTLRENPATGTAWVKIAGAAGEDVQYTITSMSGAVIANGTLLLDGEWNAIDLNCSAGMYLLTINDGTQVKTLRLIVK